MKKYLIWFLIIILTGCGQQSSDIQKESTLPIPLDKDCDGNYKIAPKPCLRLALSQPLETIDPGLIYNTNQSEIVEQLFLGLTNFQKQQDGTFKVVGELATDWQVSENGTIYTFNLRNDVSWVKKQDSKWITTKPVTAHDVVWTIRRNLIDNEYNLVSLQSIHNAIAINQIRPNEAQKREFLNNGTISVEDTLLSLGVRAIDDHTVEFILENIFPAFPKVISTASYRPLPRHVIEQYADTWIELEHIQTNGSYVLVDWQQGNDIILTKNPYYYAATDNQISKIHYYIIPETDLGLAMYKNNGLDILGGSYLELPMADIYRIKSDPFLAENLQKGPRACTAWYSINTQRLPTDNLLVRKALAAALDKQLLIDVIIKENKPAKTLVHPIAIGTADENMGIPFNLKQAKEYLKQYKEESSSQKIPTIILAHWKDEGIRKISKGVKVLLSHNLKDINIELQEDDSYWEQTKPQTTVPHIFWYANCAAYPEASNWLGFFTSFPYNLLSDNTNRLLTKLLNEADQTTDFNEQKEKYHQAEQLLTQEEVAVIPLYFTYPNILVKPRVKNWYNMPMGGQHIRNWQLVE
ncbi:peptide ABC transporter substrate-binding protein [Candidatus Halobeggiatoa sp. HSG11]|nr:peptide ABC transporter substrate-binding protein [Candidatus Halobeggiatoa sp. HSG11]